MVAVSPSTATALRHLKKMKPSDGWSVESNRSATGACGIRLLHGNAPLTKHYFLDLHLEDSTGCVLGILSCGLNGKARGQILVDGDGKIREEEEAEEEELLLGVVNITAYNPNRSMRNVTSPSKKKNHKRKSSKHRSDDDDYDDDDDGLPTAIATPIDDITSTTTLPSTQPQEGLSDEQHRRVLKGAGFLMICSMFSSVWKHLFLSTLYVIILPTFYMYAVLSCPSNESFDAKQRLKQVMRNQQQQQQQQQIQSETKSPTNNQQQNQQSKPRGWFGLGQTFQKVAASVSTEVATTLGYEVSMQTYLAATTVVTVHVPSTKNDFYWVGMFGNWYFLYSSKREQQ